MMITQSTKSKSAIHTVFNISVLVALYLLILSIIPQELIAAEGITEEGDIPVDQNIEENIEAPVETESQVIEPLSPEEQERIQQAFLDRDQYTQLINRIELESGTDVYRADLSQAYMDLGLTLQILGQHEEALDAFDKALQTVRVSSGLNSPLQIPMLQELFSSNLSLAEFGKADTFSHLIFHIARKSYLPGDERRLVALQQLGNWKLKAENEELLSEFSNALGEAIDLYQQEIKLMQTMPLEGNNLA